jgi:hypothetical protein
VRGRGRRRRNPRPPAALQWSSKAYDTKDGCARIYAAGRKVLAAIHDVRLE